MDSPQITTNWTSKLRSLLYFYQLQYSITLHVTNNIAHSNCTYYLDDDDEIDEAVFLYSVTIMVLIFVIVIKE